MAKAVEIKLATAADFFTIESIARQTWPVAYGSILSKEQLVYMLDLFYCNQALTHDVTQKNHLYYMVFLEGNAVGFIGIQHYYLPYTTKIHKLYILPQYQRLNIGKQLLDFVSQIALDSGCNSLNLNVNRYNSAKMFYEMYGFSVLKSEDIVLDFGYVMEDYVLVKSLV
ncbi:MAG: GNAT family N-acetyltransferase [Flavobacterium sp.]|nr:GNAT family N-acetyltransferase [Flavobacterium sp.]